LNDPRTTYIGTSDQDGLVDLVTEDFRLDEGDGGSVDSDETFAILEKASLGSQIAGILIRGLKRVGFLTLQKATAVAVFFFPKVWTLCEVDILLEEGDGQAARGVSWWPAMDPAKGKRHHRMRRSLTITLTVRDTCAPCAPRGPAVCKRLHPTSALENAPRTVERVSEPARLRACTRPSAVSISSGRQWITCHPQPTMSTFDGFSQSSLSQS
jgi:hypothetical protein